MPAVKPSRVSGAQGVLGPPAEVRGPAAALETPGRQGQFDQPQRASNRSLGYGRRFDMLPACTAANRVRPVTQKRRAKHNPARRMGILG